MKRHHVPLNLDVSRPVPHLVLILFVDFTNFLNRYSVPGTTSIFRPRSNKLAKTEAFLEGQPLTIESRYIGVHLVLS